MSISRRNVRAALFYLAAKGASVPREQLCLLFWPDIPENDSRRNLTRLLTHLRRELPAPEILVSGEDQISLDKQLFWCDLDEFKGLAASSKGNSGNLEQAIRLYRGAFLTGFYLPDNMEYENWISLERTKMEILYLQALSSLVEETTTKGDYESAILYARQYLETDELAEDIHRKLISLYALTGDRAKALHQYEDCVAIFERELGTDPLPETRATYQAVLDGRLQDFREVRGKDLQLSWSSHLRLDVPLVGRAQVLSSLEKTFLDVRSGHSCVVLVSGEPGIGKTRLLYSLITKCQPHAVVLFGSGDRGEASLPYHPIVEALDATSFTCPPTLSPIWLSEISRLLPKINTFKPGLPPPISLKGNEARIRLFEALCQFIATLQIDYGPVLLCMDNLHWFDRTSLSWLIHFCRQYLTKSRQILLVGTYRVEDTDKLEELRGSLARSNLLNEIQLEGLDQEAILKLLEHMLGNLVGGEVFAQRLKDATGGNPFFVLEILRTLEEENMLAGDLARLGEFPLPESIRGAVNRRLNRLHANARQVLEAGAILGSQFGFQAVRITAGRNELETAKGLDELVNRRILTQMEDGFSFSHDLVRKAVTTSISPIRFSLLHSRAGKALEKLEPEATNALAFHFDMSREWEKALHYYFQSVRKAEAIFAWQEAISQYDRMIEMLEQLDSENANAANLKQRGEVFARLIYLHRQQGNLVAYNTRLGQLDALVAECKSKQLELVSLLLRARYLHLDGYFSEALEAAERGSVLAKELKDNSAYGRLLAQSGLIYFFLGQPMLALEKLETAESLTEKSKDLELRANVIWRLAFVKCLFGHYQEALAYQKEAYVCYQRLGDDYTAAQHLTEIGNIYASLACFSESRQSLNKILQLARKTGMRDDEAHSLLAMGWLYACQGSYTMAVQTYEEASEILYILKNHHLDAVLETEMGLALYHLGDYRKSLEWIKRGLDRARTLKFRVRIANALILMAMVEIADQHFDAAKEHLQEGLSSAKESYNAELIVAGLAVAACLQRQMGNPNEALAYAEGGLELAKGIDPLAFEMWTRTEAGLALLEQDNAEAAFEHTSRAVTLIPQANQAWIRSEQVRLAHAKVLRRLERNNNSLE